MWCIHHAVAGTEKIGTQFEFVSVPYYLVRFDYSRGAKYGQSQWQYDHWKARDPKRGATRHKHDSIELRWKRADKYRASQTFHRWPGEYSRYIDHLTTIDISFVATWKQRSRNENSHSLDVNGGPQPDPMRGRNDFPKQLTNLQLFNVNNDESFPYL